VTSAVAAQLTLALLCQRDAENVADPTERRAFARLAKCALVRAERAAVAPGERELVQRVRDELAIETTGEEVKAA
jgi:hypothetical protein